MNLTPPPIEFLSYSEKIINKYGAKRKFFQDQLATIRKNRPNPQYENELQTCLALCLFVMQEHQSFMPAALNAMNVATEKSRNMSIAHTAAQMESQIKDDTFDFLDEPEKSQAKANLEQALRVAKEAAELEPCIVHCDVALISAYWQKEGESLIENVFSLEDTKYQVEAVKKLAEFIVAIVKLPLGPVIELFERVIEGGQIIRDVLQARAEDARNTNEQRNTVDDFLRTAIGWCCVTKMMTVHLGAFGQPSQCSFADAYEDVLVRFRAFRACAIS